MCYVSNDYLDIYDYLECEMSFEDMTDEQKTIHAECEEMDSIISDIAGLSYDALVREYMNEAIYETKARKVEIAKEMVKAYNM